MSDADTPKWNDQIATRAYVILVSEIAEYLGRRYGRGPSSRDYRNAECIVKHIYEQGFSDGALYVEEGPA
jgi:hypothetical protein